MPDFDRVVIVGVGLLGGSLGMALRERGLANQIIGFGRNQGRLQKAIEMGAIDSAGTDLRECTTDADLVVVCTPVQRVVDLVREASPNMAEQGLITDVGSTKAAIVEQLEDCSAFCGSHPLAGSERSGVEYARSDLFAGRTCVITPAGQSSDALIKRTLGLWSSVGANVVKMDAREHDAAIAVTSHLPHVIASALAAATPESLLPLAATGWQDTTRVASGSVEMWTQIIEENRDPVLAALEGFGQQIERWRAAIRDENREQLQSLLLAGKKIRDTVGN